MQRQRSTSRPSATTAMLLLALSLLVGERTGPGGIQLFASAAVHDVGTSSPFPAFVTPKTTTPRYQQQRTGICSSCNGHAFCSVGQRTQRKRRNGWFESRLHQSTVAVAEPRARNSTHDDASATMVTAFAFDNATMTATTAATTSARTRNNHIPRDYLPEDVASRETGGSDSDIVQPDDRHAEGVDALANYFAPRSSNMDNKFGGGGGCGDNIESKGYGPINDDQDDDDHRRAHALAPPGYGKTLLALLTMTELRARGESINTALYIVPTIPLVDQALEACDKYGIFRDVPHNRMIVASKTSRKEKRTTKAEVIAEFLESSRAQNETSFLACTYKSLHRVGPQDGCAETAAYGLYDENIFINRRLFVTGTAKNYTDTPQRRQILGSKLNDKDGSRSLVTKRSSPEQEDSDRVKARSFRNRDLYGPCLFLKTNQDCVDKNITVPVKLCCLSKREMFSELGRELNISFYTRDEIVPFATMAAYSKLNTTKGVSFHSLVARSEDFVELAKPLFEETGFYISHVNGKMRAAEQERRLAKSRSVAKSHMANCQLWREGVDVPEWDLVVVADAVSDHVIAQQIIGRVSRRHPGKECGYVFIPDLFDEENGFEAGSEGYDSFVSIFQAMVADDPQLQRDVLFVSGQNLENRTLDVTEYPARLKERFQLPASVPLPIQQEFIRNVVVEMGGNKGKDSAWMDWYNLLKKYKEREGDCLVPSGHVEEGKGLGKWVSMQRTALKNGSMTSRRKELLDEIGFCWDADESAWQEHYALLKKYKEREGDCLVPSGHVEEGKGLGNWVNRQRRALQKGSMTSRRKELLDEIGFCWDAMESAWQEHYALLKKYKEREGDCLVPSGHVEEGKGLGKWVSMQRTALKNGSMTSRRKEMLDEIGFCWDADESAWQEHYALLKKYKEREGDCLVPYEHVEEDKGLGKWVSSQRDALRNERMTSRRKELLDEIGFCWDAMESAWQENYALLKKYKEREGDCLVPSGHVEEGKGLGKWVSRQRRALQKGSMTSRRKELLDEIGFCWDAFEYEWERNFKLLEQFAKREGHCDVPSKHEEDGQPLGLWLMRQRQRQKKGTLETSQQERLEKLGVTWNLQEMRNNMSWMRKYSLLVKFKEREGHCRVPQKHKEEGENLGYWLAEQKKAHRKGKLDSERYRKLNELGVEW